VNSDPVDLNAMIIYTNEGNPLGLKLLSTAKFAKKNVELKIVTLNCKLSSYQFVKHKSHCHKHFFIESKTNLLYFH
jgi:hypothetical protein